MVSRIDGYCYRSKVQEEKIKDSSASARRKRKQNEAYKSSHPIAVKNPKCQLKNYQPQLPPPIHKKTSEVSKTQTLPSPVLKPDITLFRSIRTMIPFHDSQGKEIPVPYRFEWNMPARFSPPVLAKNRLS